MAFTEFDGELDKAPVQGTFTEFDGELDAPDPKRELPAGVKPSEGRGKGVPIESYTPPAREGPSKSLADIKSAKRAVDQERADMPQLFQRGGPLADDAAMRRVAQESGQVGTPGYSQLDQTTQPPRIPKQAPQELRSNENTIYPTGGVVEAVKAAPGIAARGLAESALTVGKVLADYGLTLPGGPSSREFGEMGKQFEKGNRKATMALSDKNLVDMGPLLNAVVPSSRTVAEGLSEVGRQVALNMVLPGGIIVDAGFKGVNEAQMAGLSPGAALLIGVLKAGTEGVPEHFSAKFALKEGANINVGAMLKDPKIALEATKRFGAAMGVELGSEQASAVSSWLVDKMTNDPSATLDRLGTDMTDAIKSTLIQAPGMMAAGKIGSSAMAAARKITAYDIAAQRGFNVNPPYETDTPDAQRKKTVGIFNAAVAQYGIDPDAAKRATEAANSMPAEMVGPFLARMTEALQKRKLVGKPVDPHALDTLTAGPIQDPKVLEAEAKAAETGKAGEKPSESANSVGFSPETEDLTGLSEPSTIDTAAHAAAPSPKNELPEPTPAQKLAGNYQKGHAKIGGLDISIENPEGSQRTGTSPDGKAWSNTMAQHYGYIRGTVAADKEHIDTFIRPGTDAAYSGPVFVVDQNHRDGTFDEPKVMLGFDTEADAKAAYLSNYEKGWTGLRNITPMTMDGFKAWAFDPAKSIRPAAQGDDGGSKKGPSGARAVQAPAVSDVAERQGQVPQPKESVLPQLRGPGDQGRPAAGGELPGVSGSGGRAADSTAHSGTEADQRALRAGQSDVGDEAGAGQQPAKKPKPDVGRSNANPDGMGTRAPGGQNDAAQPAGTRDDAGTGTRVIARVGRAPKQALPIELRQAKDGTLSAWHDGYEVVDFENGEPLKIPADATDAQAFEMVKAANPFSKANRYFDTPKADAAAPAPPAAPITAPAAAPAPAAAAPAPITPPADSGVKAPKADKAELRPFRRADGSIGYEAVPIIEAEAPAPAPAAEPAAAPKPGGDLFDTGETLALFNRVRRYASGLSRLGDLGAGSKGAGGMDLSGVGVDVGQLSNNAIDTIANAAINLRAAVFVDSGAFSAFRRGLKGGETKPMDFDAILSRYDDILNAIGTENAAEITDYPRPLLVMPDVVGDQAASLALVEKYKDWISIEAKANTSRPIVPIQKGELSMAEAYARVVEILGTDDFIVGIPSNEKAVTPEELTAFLREAKPNAIHILGAASQKNLMPRLQSVIESGQAESMEVTADASPIRNQILTAVQNGAKRGDSIEQHLFKTGAAPAEAEVPAKGELPIPVADFAAALEAVPDVFDAPKTTVRIEAQAKQATTLTPDQAKAKIEEWRAHALAQGKTNQNAGRVVLSLFDTSGEWSAPWHEAGYEVHRFDIQDGVDINDFSVEYLTDTLGLSDVYAIIAAPPCTDFSSSGAHAWQKKDADGRTAASIRLVEQTLNTVELFKPAVWAMENPTGRLGSVRKDGAGLMGLPKPRMTFQPNNFGDPYTKRTLLWGDFETNLPLAPVEATEGSKVTEKLSSSDKYGRSLTPEGFAYAFFMANNAVDLGPAAELAREFRGVDKALLQQALDAGMKPAQAKSAIEDAFYDGDIEGANEALKAAMPKPKPPAAPAPTVPKVAQLSDSEAFSGDYAAFEGRTVEQTVSISDTGGTATLRIDAAKAMRALDARLKTLTELKGCIGRAA